MRDSKAQGAKPVSRKTKVKLETETEPVEISFFITNQILTIITTACGFWQDPLNHPPPSPSGMIVHLLGQIHTAPHLRELTMNADLLTAQADPQKSLKTYVSYIHSEFCLSSLASAN